MTDTARVSVRVLCVEYAGVRYITCQRRHSAVKVIRSVGRHLVRDERRGRVSAIAARVCCVRVCRWFTYGVCGYAGTVGARRTSSFQ